MPNTHHYEVHVKRFIIIIIIPVVLLSRFMPVDMFDVEPIP
jgi:hypothetical protein